MNEKSEAVRQSYIRILGGEQYHGHLYAESQVIEVLKKMPEIEMVNFTAMCMSGELAARSDSSRFELAEVECIAELLIGYGDRLNEIGQENEADHDSLVVIGAVLDCLGKSIQALFAHLRRKDGAE